MSLFCLAIRPLLARLDVDGPAFTSIFQGAARWQTYVALAVSSNFYGDTGLALASVAMVAIIPLVNVFSVSVLAHYASPEKQSVRAIAMTVVRNPLIWACAIGLAINVLHLPLPTIWHEVADALGRSSLAIGLLVTGAGLHLEGLFRPSQGAAVGVFLKLVLMPVLAIGLALGFGLSRGRVIEPLCNGPANGGRCSASGADHRAPDHFGRHHHANRDRACGVTAFSCAPRGRCSRPPRRRSTQRGQVSVTINAICAMTAVFHAPCMITVSQVEPAR
jgi:hypothetical protein